MMKLLLRLPSAIMFDLSSAIRLISRDYPVSVGRAGHCLDEFCLHGDKLYGQADACFALQRRL